MSLSDTQEGIMYKWKKFIGYDDYVRFLNRNKIRPEHIISMREYYPERKVVIVLVYFDPNEEYKEPDKPGKKLKLRINTPRK